MHFTEAFIQSDLHLLFKVHICRRDEICQNLQKYTRKVIFKNWNISLPRPNYVNYAIYSSIYSQQRRSTHLQKQIQTNPVTIATLKKNNHQICLFLT